MSETEGWFGSSGKLKLAYWYLTRPLRPGHRSCRMCEVVNEHPDGQYQCWAHRRFGTRKRDYYLEGQQ